MRTLIGYKYETVRVAVFMKAITEVQRKPRKAEKTVGGLLRRIQTGRGSKERQGSRDGLINWLRV